FKKFEDFTIDLNEHFTLLVGENGSGKTSVLDGLAVALGVWLSFIPELRRLVSPRSILENEIRKVATESGDRILFEDRLPVSISCNAVMPCENEHAIWDIGISNEGEREGHLSHLNSAMQHLIERTRTGK